MSQADLQGSAAFQYPTADECEAQLLATMRNLLRDSARLAKAEKGSEASVALRDRVDRSWEQITRDLAILRAQERREARLAVRDTLHTRLASFYEEARSAPGPVALLTWENTFKAAMQWLARWNGSGR
jgi:hypothetical protein